MSFVGCGGDATTPEPEPEPTTCDAPALALVDGSCMRPGVPEDGCDPGFVHDGGYGCEPIVPAEACEPPLMAVVGDSMCRAIMPCGEGRWGAIPVEDATQFVDAAYAGTDSDGSEARPWTTITEAIAVAPPNGLIAVTDGTYTEDLAIVQAVRIRGRCPERVAIVGTGAEVAAVVLYGSADGAELGGLSITGPAEGFVQLGSQGVVLDQVYIHDTGRGANVQNTLGAASLTVRDSLIARATGYATIAVGAALTVERTAVVDTQPLEGVARGLSVESCNGPNCGAIESSTARLVGSLVEGSFEAGVIAQGSHLDVEASVVRDTLPDAQTGRFGRGVVFESCLPESGCPTALPSTGTVSGSLVDNNVVAGIAVVAAEIAVDRTVIRRTQRSPTDDFAGEGVRAELLCADAETCYPGTGAVIDLRRSLIEDNHDAGVLLSSSTGTVEDVVVRRTEPSVGEGFGRGIVAQSCGVGVNCDVPSPTWLELRRSLVEDNHELGVALLDATGIVEDVIIRGTAPSVADGAFGDGITAFSVDGSASVDVARSQIVDSARAGLSSFGASISLQDSAIRCAAFALTGQDVDSFAFSFEDRGGNLCGCPEAVESCKLAEPMLEPPSPLSP